MHVSFRVQLYVVVNTGSQPLPTGKHRLQLEKSSLTITNYCLFRRLTIFVLGSTTQGMLGSERLVLRVHDYGK